MADFVMALTWASIFFGLVSSAAKVLVTDKSSKLSVARARRQLPCKLFKDRSLLNDCRAVPDAKLRSVRESGSVLKGIGFSALYRTVVRKSTCFICCPKQLSFRITLGGGRRLSSSCNLLERHVSPPEKIDVHRARWNAGPEVWKYVAGAVWRSKRRTRRCHAVFHSRIELRRPCSQ